MFFICLFFVLQTFNLMEDDFGTLREYNDYLEHVEELIYKMTNEIDIAQIEEETKAFQERHADTIERNRRRLNSDDQWIKETIEEEAKTSAQNHNDSMGEVEYCAFTNFYF